MLLAAPLIAPKLDVESVGEAKSVGEARFCDPASVFGEGGGRATLGHEENALGWNLESVAEGEDFVEILLVGKDEFEKGFG